MARTAAQRVQDRLDGLVRRTRMIVEIENVSLTNVWEESFKDRETGEDVKYFRALISSSGEPPMQLGVAVDDFELLRSLIGSVGTAFVEIDAQPGRRVRVRLRGME